MPSPEELAQRIAADIADGRVVDFAALEREGVLPAALLASLRTLARVRAAAKDASEPLPPPPPGYEVVRELGRGSYARVYLARDVSLRRDVALKVLAPFAGATAEDRERFVREARIVATLQHPHVVRLYALHEQVDGIALALEWIDGLTLDRVVEINGPMHPVDAANAALDVLDALAALHARGVVHRDVKPTNVMRERGGRIVLLDFGVARGTGDGLGEIGKSAGSPAFEAPELAAAGTADVRSDLYSVGALLYWLVTGKLPVGGRTAAELREQGRLGAIVPLEERRQGLPPAFVAIVRRALALDPRARPASAAVMAKELRAALASMVVSQRAWRLPRRLAMVVGVMVLSAPAWLLGRALLPDPAAHDRMPVGWLRYEVRENLWSCAVPPRPGPLHFHEEYQPPVGGARPRVVATGTAIQSVLDQTQPGDVVVVEPGTYREALRIERPLTLCSRDGPERTVIDASGCLAPAILVEDVCRAGVRIAGFSITGGVGRGQPEDVVARKERAVDRHGGGICIRCPGQQDGDPPIKHRIEHCVVYGNGHRGATFGGGIALSLDGDQQRTSITDCLVFGNAAWGCGGGVSVMGNGTAKFERCTIAWNGDGDLHGNQGGIGYGHGAKVVVTGCILFGNSGEQLGEMRDFERSAAPSVASSCIETWTGPDAVTDPPRFVDPRAGDFRLQGDSPLLTREGVPPYGALGGAR